MVAKLLPLSLQTSEGIGSPGVSSCLCKKQFLPSYASLQQKEATKWSLEMVKSIGTALKSKVWWPMISRDWWHLSFPIICLTVEENPNWGNWPDQGSNPGQLGERQRCYPSTTAVVDMYRMALYPESSCATDANLKEVDRQWIAQKLIFL